MVPELLVHEVERKRMLSDGQYGSRRRRSPMNVVAIMVVSAHVVWIQGNIAALLLMDLRAALPNVGRGRLFH
jgi:hypothetical protein